MQVDVIQLIKEFEGFAAKPYSDFKGDSIGYGHLYPKGTAPTSITEAEATELLKKDVAAISKEVDALVKVELNPNQKAAIVSFVYNLGSPAFKKSTLLRRINMNLMQAAAAEFDRWINAGGKPNEGLKKRRARERALFEQKV